MKQLLWLVRKDLWRFFSDRNGALLTILIPVVLAAMLGMLFAPRDGNTSVELLVVNEDGHGESAARLVASLEADDALKVTEVDRAEAMKRLRAGRASVALALPEGASSLLEPMALFGVAAAPDGLELELLYDPSRSSEAQIVGGLIQKHVMQTSAGQLTDPDRMKSWFGQMSTAARVGSLVTGNDAEKGAWLRFADSGEQLADAMKADADADGAGAGEATGPPGEVELGLPLARRAVVSEDASRGYDGYAHNFAGMLCMFLLFWAADAAKELVAERSQGSLMRLRMSALSKGRLMTGRALSVMAVGLIITTAVYTVGIAVFGIEVLGPVTGFVLVCVALSAFTAGFALFLAGIGRTERQISNIGTFAILMLSFLGGAWLPSFLMPEWLRQVTPVLPTFWATDGLAAMTWRGLDLQAALLPAGVLVGYGALLGAIGIKTFRWDRA